MTDVQNERILRGYDPVSHSPVPLQVGTTAIDPNNNEIYAPLQVVGGTGGGGGADTQYTDGLAPPTSPIGNALVFDDSGIWHDVGVDHPLPVTGTFTPAANQRVSSLANDYATGAIVDLLSLLNVTGTAADANTVNTVMGRLTKIRDLLNAALTVSVNNFPATQPISAATLPLPTGAAQEAGHLATIDTSTAASKTDLDTIVTNTNKIPASPAQEAGNLATVATNTTNIGASADAAVTGDNAGSLSGKLRGLTKIFTDIWDSVNHRIKVDGSGVTQPVSGTFWQATQPVSGTFWQATQPVNGTVTGNQGTPNTLANKWPVQVSDGTNTMPTGDAAARTIHTTVDNASVPVTGTFWQATQPVSGTITANEGGTWTVQPGNTPNTSPWLVQDVVAATGGEIPYHNLTAATTNFTNVKAVACQMYSCRLSNTSASTIFVKLYDKATTPATTDTPKSTIQVPATSTVLLTFPHGMTFTSGFGWGATGAVANADATAIAANCIVDFSLNS